MRLLPRSRVLSLARHDSDAGKYLMRFSRSSSDSRFARLHTYEHSVSRSQGQQSQQRRCEHSRIIRYIRPYSFFTYTSIVYAVKNTVLLSTKIPVIIDIR